MRSVPNIRTSIIIPTHNQVAMLKRLVTGLNNTALDFDDELELVIVDNQSDEVELLAFLDTLAVNAPTPFKLIKVLRYPHKFNFSAINNLAATHCSGEYLCFLNNDVEIIHNDWLQALSLPMQRKTTGCVGAMLYYPDNTIQHAGVFLDLKNVAGHLYKHYPRGSAGQQDFLLSEQVVSAVTAACLLVRKSIFDQVSGFNESYAVAFNDVDFCLKVQQAGFQNIWTPHAELFHHESKSRGRSHQRSWLQKLRHKKEVRLMQRTWHSQMASEPHAIHVSAQKEPLIDAAD